MTASGTAGDVVRRTAWAKVNLTLHVTGRRADGYHELDSLIVFAGLGDELRIAPAAELVLEVEGPFAAALGAGRKSGPAGAVAPEDRVRVNQIDGLTLVVDAAKHEGEPT